jgi:hypothetical protein
MIDWGQALRVLLACLALAGLAWVLIALVLSARRGGKAVRSFGAALMLFGWGHMRDPRNDTVAEAKDGRVDRGTHSGEPIDPDTR